MDSPLIPSKATSSLDCISLPICGKLFSFRTHALNGRIMIFILLMSLFSIFLDLLAILGVASSDKDLDIIILRQQVRILQRKLKMHVQISDPERMILATLVDKCTHYGWCTPAS